jgi:hypothetical protein
VNAPVHPLLWQAFVGVREYLWPVYTAAGIQLWLESANRNLDHRPPIEVWAEGEYDRVLTEARRVGGEG